jgi:hypothetical protein
MSLLDDIILLPAPLAPLSPHPLQKQATFSLGGQKNSRSLQIGGPWMVGLTSPVQAGGRWLDLCTRLSERGLLLDCSIAALEKLPVASIPRRLFRQRVGTPLNLDELQSADVVEVSCQQSSSGIWGWPPEVDSTQRMSDWLGAVRHVIGQNTPFGLGVHAGIDDQSLQAIIHWPIDFISLYAENATELLVDSIAKLRVQWKTQNLQIPLLVRAPLKRAEHLVKIISMGASAVTVDGYLAELWQHSAHSVSSFLGTKLPSTVATPKCPIAEHLEQLQVKLIEALQTTRSSGPAELVSWLRALTPTAARLANIPLLGDKYSC